MFFFEEDEVDTHGGGHGAHDACHLEEDGGAGGAVVGTGHGAAVVALRGVVVGPGATVPVGSEDDAMVGLWIEEAYDVLARYCGAVPEHGAEVLYDDGVAGTPHLRGEPCGTAFPPFAAGDAVAEGELTLDIGVGRIGGEFGSGDGGVIRRRRRRCGVAAAGAVFASEKQQQTGCCC